MLEAGGIGRDPIDNVARRHGGMIGQPERLQMREQTLAKIGNHAMAGLAREARMKHHHELMRELDQQPGNDEADDETLARIGKERQRCSDWRGPASTKEAHRTQ